MGGRQTCSASLQVTADDVAQSFVALAKTSKSTGAVITVDGEYRGGSWGDAHAQACGPRASPPASLCHEASTTAKRRSSATDKDRDARGPVRV